MSDYRDKAAELRRQVVWASNEAIDTISQALLEAHEAGRAEMREEAARVAEAEKLAGTPPDYLSAFEISVAEGATIATAKSIASEIRSIK